jgi:hypothetical protein
MGVCDLWKHLHFDKKKLLYECEVSCNRIMKGGEIFVLKGFGVLHVKFMVREWCGILVIHKQ